MDNNHNTPSFLNAATAACPMLLFTAMEVKKARVHGMAVWIGVGSEAANNHLHHHQVDSLS